MADQDKVRGRGRGVRERHLYDPARDELIEVVLRQSRILANEVDPTDEAIQAGD